jgi:hypothetical protein
VTDLASIASLATAGGTLVLAVATFGSVRSANRAARVAERALLAGLRPVLAPARPEDPDQDISWGDGHWTHLAGGYAGVEMTDEHVYLAMPLRNVGNGIAVIQGWQVRPVWDGTLDVSDADAFRAQRRDLYVSSGDIGFWQGGIALRDNPFREHDEEMFGALGRVISDRERFMIDLLYSDHEGGQRTISRFGLWPDDDSDAWRCIVARHQNMDRRDPR